MSAEAAEIDCPAGIRVGRNPYRTEQIALKIRINPRSKMAVLIRLQHMLAYIAIHV